MFRGSPPSSRRPAVRPGFTLVEILLVVIILGILASVVIASISNSTGDARNSAFVSSIKTFAEQFQMYYARNGQWPADRLPGEVPPEMAPQLDNTPWIDPTPIGGQWDWDGAQFGTQAAVSVHMPDRTDKEMTVIDKMLDDGDLTTGGFRKRSNGYMYIIEP